MYKKLKQLGSKIDLPKNPDQALLESVPNPHKGTDYVVRFTCPEFTSMCPLTGQPDFAKIIIDYIPGIKILESKSLKLYLHSFRNHGDFHEACTIAIAKRIIKEVKPKWLRITGLWYPRGGIPIDIFYQTSATPKNVYVPEIQKIDYSGR
jgi:7-cyano-7-deazaguanine reductase